MLKSLFNWFLKRLPINEFITRHLTQYYLPKNLNFWYFFGSLALFLLFLQVLTGLWLTMFYTPTPEAAFSSIETMMREVPYGWLLRYLHSTGASAFFIIIYCHIFRSLLYGSYKKPRELVWLLGMGLYVLLLLEAFMGYLLPWGQTSYWASQVSTSLLSSIPKIGQALTTWVRGNSVVSSETLHRFFALHIIGIPLFLIFLVRLHLSALHKVGSNNPDGIFIPVKSHIHKKSRYTVPFHPFYTVKELFSVLIFLFIFLLVVFFAPEMYGYFLEPNNFIPADPLLTPLHIEPLWYLAPFYGVLCVIPNKLLGILMMGSTIAILFTLPWLDRSPVRSMRYRGCYSRFALVIFILSFALLSYISTTTITPIKVFLIQSLLLLYFLFFCLMPFYTKYEKNKPLPKSILCGK
jgi:ubiquinol-cytochrome c reductase cytochrome b subunit